MNTSGKRVNKGWGHELIFADTKDYCGKLLVFDKKGKKFSMHFHDKKDETWYVYKGSFKISYIITDTAETKEVILNTADVWHNKRLSLHQLTSLEDDSIIFEVSTHDDPEDSYRVAPGDSQS
jgi:mannose-6-phosphate isomerase